MNLRDLVLNHVYFQIDPADRSRPFAIMIILVLAAPDFRLHEIYECLCSIRLGQHNAGHVRQDDKFAELRSGRHQIFYIHS
jgi:hypothetical protein